MLNTLECNLYPVCKVTQLNGCKKFRGSLWRVCVCCECVLYDAKVRMATLVFPAWPLTPREVTTLVCVACAFWNTARATSVTRFLIPFTWPPHLHHHHLHHLHPHPTLWWHKHFNLVIYHQIKTCKTLEPMMDNPIFVYETQQKLQ